MSAAPGLSDHYLFQWAQAPNASQMQLNNGRGGITFPSLAVQSLGPSQLLPFGNAIGFPAFGSEQIEVSVENVINNGGVDVVFQMKKVMPVGSNNRAATTVLSQAAPAGGFVQATANELEVIVAANTMKTISFPWSTPGFNIGFYANAAPAAGQLVQVFIYMRASSSPFQPQA